MTGGNFATWSKVPTEVRLLLSHKNWEVGVLSPSMFIFQRDNSQVLKKDISGHKAHKIFH